MMDSAFVSTSLDRTGHMLIYLGLPLASGGLIWFYYSYRQWSDAFNLTSRNLSAYTMVIGFILAGIGLGMTYVGFGVFQRWLVTYHAYVDDSEIPLEIMGYTFQFSTSQYQRAFDLGGLPSHELVFILGLGIIITLGSIGAMVRRDFVVVPFRIHLLGAIYGICMTLIMAVLLYSWLNNIAVEIYDGQHIRNTMTY